MGRYEAVLLEEKSSLLKYFDMVMIDAKSFSLEDHQRLMGKDNYNDDKISIFLGKMALEERHKLIKYRSEGLDLIELKVVFLKMIT